MPELIQPVPSGSLFGSFSSQIHTRQPIEEGSRWHPLLSRQRARRAIKRSAERAARTLHVVDVENLVGCGKPALPAVTALRSLYGDVVHITPLDQIVVACNPGCLLDVAVGWGLGCARYRAGAGRDGADWELLDVLESERVGERFSQVVIASGDDIFAPMAARLAAAGCHVTVVSRRTSLSAQLRLAAMRVVYLPDTEATERPAPAVLRRVA